MNIKFATVAAAVLLASGCAQNGTVKPPAEPDDSAPVARATSSGSSPLMAQASAVRAAG
jgi:hypothetical protein